MRIVALTTIAVGIALTAEAYGQSSSNEGTGNICLPTSAADYDKLERSQFGVHNLSGTASLEVVCPVNLLESGSEFRATVYNRNSLETMTCWYYQMDADGTVLFASPQSKTGSLNSGPQSMVWANPPVSLNMAVLCNIPKKTTQFSHVTWFGWTN